MPRILVACEDPSIRGFIAAAIGSAGWDAVLVEDGVQALRMFDQDHGDIEAVVVSLRLPGLAGLDLCQQIRQESGVAVIAISSRGPDDEIVAAIDAGADDCLVAPLSASVLVAKLRAALRRARAAGGTDDDRLAVGDVILDPGARALVKRGVPIPVTRTELGILAYLMRNAGRIVSPAQVMRHVWGEAHEHRTGVLRIAILRLRRKIEDQPGAPRYIVTHPGLGYSFTAER